MASAVLNLKRDKNSFPIGTRQFSTEMYGADLDNGVEATITVPADAAHAFIAYEVGATIAVWVSDATITIPTANSFSLNGATQNPEWVDVSGVTTLFFKTNADTSVDVTFYKS